jgi:hypothetical protein
MKRQRKGRLAFLKAGNLGIVEIISPVQAYLYHNLCGYGFGITFDFYYVNS